MDSARRTNLPYSRKAKDLKASGSSFVDEFVTAYLRSFKTPLSERILELYLSGDHKSLIELEIEPSSYSSVEGFREDYASVKLLSKADFLDLGVDKRKKALDSIWIREEINRGVNRRFTNLREADPFILDCAYQCADELSLLLGRFDPNCMIEDAGWGPGATFDVRRRSATYATKFRLDCGISPYLATLVRRSLPQEWPSWVNIQGDLDIRESNKVVTVPKNAKTDRLIAIEPGLNIWFQKGIGKLVRRRLLKFGTDLNDQSKNQRFARMGSITGHLATLDLKDASNSMCVEPVKFLLQNSRDWLHAFDCSRSHHGDIPLTDAKEVKRHKWELFSSMGNGFTFELESAIFLALSRVAVKRSRGSLRDVAVFGDDIVVPTESVALLSRLLNFFGFELNTEKSFSSGYFRESCGEHYFKGVNCKPIFLKKKVSSLYEKYKLINSVRLQAHSWVDQTQACDGRFADCWAHCVGLLPQGDRLFASRGASSDGALIGNFDEALGSKPTRLRRPRHCIEGVEVRIYSGLQRFVRGEGSFDDWTATDHSPVLAWLWLASQRSDRSDLSSEPGSLDKLPLKVSMRRSWVLISSWYNLGPWVTNP